MGLWEESLFLAFLVRPYPAAWVAEQPVKTASASLS